MEPKILFFDIETSPNLAYVWGKYEQDVIAYKNESQILCYAAKWFGNKSTFAQALPDFKGYQYDDPDDKQLVKAIWDLFDEADIIVAHNGDRFDIRKMNARFIYHKLPPPSPYKTVDTKKIAKHVAMFNSNKLDDLGKYLNEGKKITTSFGLWLGCMAGDKDSWKQMVKYNRQDVELLERIYLRLRPWTKYHPNIGIYTDSAVCPRCGSDKIEFRGYGVNSVTKYRRFKCRQCGGWGSCALNAKKEILRSK